MQRHARRCRSKCSNSTRTRVEAGMSGTLLGNQAAQLPRGTRDMPPGAFSRRSSQLPLIPLHHHF
ncbi:unnamed protein product, partial [Ascophyllum nodosum]